MGRDATGVVNLMQTSVGTIRNTHKTLSTSNAPKIGVLSLTTGTGKEEGIAGFREEL